MKKLEFQEQLKAIKRIFSRADSADMPLWLDGGWAIDARIRKVTREHDDIDIVFPEDKKAEYLSILENLGFEITETTEYGFLSKKNDIVVDSEIGIRKGEHYIVEGYPGICPDIREGVLEGVSLRCIGWEKMYYEFLFLEQEVKKADWKPKHYASLRLIEDNIPLSRRAELDSSFSIELNKQKIVRFLAQSTAKQSALTISKEFGTSTYSVWKSLKELEEDGTITLAPLSTSGKVSSHSYIKLNEKKLKT